MFLIAAAAFLGLSTAVVVAGVFPVERAIYEWIHHVVPTAAVPAAFTLTKLGSERFVFLAAIVILVLLPTRLLVRWWLWVIVVIAATWFEDVAKVIIGRPRPVSFRPGFPSGHTTTAAAFYFLLAYLSGRILPRSRWRTGAWVLAVSIVATVAFTRVVLQAHWPLDTIGGAALGLTLVAAAAWWHEHHPAAVPAPGTARRKFAAWLSKGIDVVPVPFYGALFVTPPFVGEDSPLDLVCDVAGAAVILVGICLRLSAVRQPGLRPSAAGDDSVLVTTGPYAYVRHPMYVANVLIGIGIGLFAENVAVLVVIPAVLCLMYRLIVPLEEEQLLARFGPAYERYRAQVPRWIPTDLRRKARTRPQSVWTALHLDRRSTLTTTVLAVVAQISESWPHLLR